jgi:hypothetical protein
MTKETVFQGWNVLIVDDSLPSLDIVQVILNHHGQLSTVRPMGWRR